MLSEHTIEILKALFVAIADHELTIEKQRQLLGQLEEFEPYATFVRLDRNNNGFLGARDIYNFLQDNECNDVTLDDCEYLVRFFDSDEDRVLNYTDYMQCVITWDDTYLRAAVTQRDPYGVNPDEYLSPVLERELAALFEKEIAYHREIEIIKRDLHDAHDFTPKKAFYEIDQERINYIDHDNIESFLYRWGFSATEEELTAIIRRIDVSADASASMNEFEEALRPVYLDDFDDNGQNHPSNSSYAPKLANPSIIKLENLSSGYYSEIGHSKDMSFEPSKPSKSSKKSKHNPEEMPISRSYYERKR